ncbi:YfbU family protein [Tenacibaculum finnmarkense]|uniref:YfbU family protein n=1 Tax=Tenacibaculum finnmarkense TaxID=2781243 RepID=UPI001EFA7F0F|nr:YfbU family protein [Tenacibaculum finnmarkense]MCG8734762.1 YfbU family protein [Tenacibaculum finnmarkense]WCC41463.1 YfbU family protein [Tenacibaculum finnmarkense]
MELDIKERLQLSFQLRILEKLYPDEQEYYANHRKAIEDGYQLHYDWITEYLSEGLTKDECKFVLDVLDMYSSFYFTIRDLKESKLSIESVKFPGFDGNNETMFMAYTKYFIEDLDRFGSIKESTNGYYNSHMRMIPKYQKMLVRWKDFKVDYQYILTEDNIKELLDIKAY